MVMVVLILMMKILCLARRTKDVNVSGMVRYRQTAGFNGIVDSDSQTNIDNNLSLFGVPPASLSPGTVHDGRQEYDLNLKTTYKDFYFEGYIFNKNQGPFIRPNIL